MRERMHIATSHRAHTWTTSFPALLPVLCTVTDTLKSSSVPMVDFERLKSVLRNL